MQQLILINSDPRQTRVAVIENGELQEIYVELSHKPELVGNIYKGKIVRLLPGMQAVFIDIGIERTAFLHQANFTSKLREGQELLVQVIKDPVDGKGARLTTELTLSSRSLVFVSTLKQLSISSKIVATAERERLQQLLAANDAESISNFIIRTAAANAPSLENDKAYLLNKWQEIMSAAKSAKTGDLIYKDPALPIRAFRDIITHDNAKVLIDDAKLLPELQDYVAVFMPNFNGSIEVYTAARPLFDEYKLKDEINIALERKVPLKNGGYLIIDQHEAMTTIDVNTGSYVGNKNLESTVYSTNMEAVDIICKQIRLRNLGGIIIIDFIDMRKREHMDQVLQELNKKILRDKIKTKINDFSPLGLIEMTRQRVRPSLQQTLCKQCQACQGNGVIIADII
jgi:ribonuclease G